MLRINLITPKAEPTACKDVFILPLWQDTNLRQPHMLIKLKSWFGDFRYSLKKVVVSYKNN